MTAELTVLYAFCGAAGFLGYLPQIWCLWKDATCAKSTSLATWSWWTFSSTVAVTYALIINKDPAFIMVASSNFFGCLTVASLATYRRYIPCIK